MFSNKTISVIKSIKDFADNRKGTMRVYFPDKTFRDMSAQEIAQMEFKGFVEIAARLDGLAIKKENPPV